jgi:SAM-dependent methyltransferase
MDPYRDIAELYDREHDTFQDDVNFYRNVVTEGPVLEIGAGSGRVLAQLAATGLEVWGIDSSDAMIERARGRLVDAPNAHLALASATDFSLGQQFAFVLLPLNVLWHLDSLDDQLRALRMARRHTRPGGTLVVDVSNPLALLDQGASGEVRERSRWLSEEGTVVAYSSTWDDEAAQQLTVQLTYETVDASGSVRRKHSSLHFRYLYKAELELLLRISGYRLQQVYGSYDLEPYSGSSPNIIVLATTSPPQNEDG